MQSCTFGNNEQCRTCISKLKWIARNSINSAITILLISFNKRYIIYVIVIYAHVNLVRGR